MIDFLKRNAPVFVIGFLTLLVFVGIIIAGQKNDVNGPVLEKNLVPISTLINENTNERGNKDAKIILVEFADFECPACGAVHPIVTRIYEKYKDKIRFAFRNFPLPQHKYARVSAQAVLAAGAQGKFWEYGDILFENQDKLDRQSLIDNAQALGLDVDKFTNDLDNPVYIQIINADLKAGDEIGIHSTPTFYLNGEKMVFGSFVTFEQLVQKAVEQYYPQTAEESSQSSQSSQSPQPTE